MYKVAFFTLAVLISTAISAGLFTLKFRNQYLPLDEIKSSLGSLRAITDANNTIGCLSYTQEPETVFQVANAMVPASIIPNDSHVDTLLVVFRSEARDSVLNSLLDNHRIIWQAASRRYFFLLIHNAKYE